MSIKLLTRPNTEELYVNTPETGINLHKTQLKSSVTNNDYIYQLPPIPTSYDVPLVAVSTLPLNSDTITTTWVSPTEAGVVPANLTVDNLTVNNITLLGTTGPSKLTTIDSNLVVSGESLVETNLRVQGNADIRTVGITNEPNTHKTTLEFDGTTNINYKLPETSPSDADPHIIVANNLNQMVWLKYSEPTISSTGYYINKTFSVELSGNTIVPYELGADTFNNLTPLEINKNYLVKIIYRRIKKTQGTVSEEAWNFTSRLVNLGGFQIIPTSMESQFGFINFQSEDTFVSYTFDYLIRTTGAIPVWEFTILSNATESNAKMLVENATVYVLPQSNLVSKP
jgi:hypothetical protein